MHTHKKPLALFAAAALILQIALPGVSSAQLTSGTSFGPILGSSMPDSGRSGSCRTMGGQELCLLDERVMVYYKPSSTASCGGVAECNTLTAVAPAGTQYVTVKAWGAAGGSVGNSTGGGSGAFARATYQMGAGQGVTATVGGGGYGGGQTRFKDPGAGGGGFTKVVTPNGMIWAAGGGGEGSDAPEDGPYAGHGGGRGGIPVGGTGAGSGGGGGGADGILSCFPEFCPTATRLGTYQQGGYGQGASNGSLNPSYSKGSGGFNGGGGGGKSVYTISYANRQTSYSVTAGGGGGGGGYEGGNGATGSSDARGKGGGGGASLVSGGHVFGENLYAARTADSDYVASMMIDGAMTSLSGKGVSKTFLAPTLLGGPGAAIVQFWGIEPPAEAPAVSISSNPTGITIGDSASLSWASSDPASSCVASTVSPGAGSWAGSKPVSGSSPVTPSATGTKSYSIACSNSYGSNSASVSLAVNDAVVTPDPENPSEPENPSGPGNPVVPGNQPGFSLGPNQSVDMRFLSGGSGTSRIVQIPVNRVGSFSGAIRVIVDRIEPVPAGVTPSFSLDGGSFSAAGNSVIVSGSDASATLSVMLSGSISDACGKADAPNCRAYSVVIRGIDESGTLPIGESEDFLFIRINQQSGAPKFQEL
jgi:hypothetical protein